MKMTMLAGLLPALLVSGVGGGIALASGGHPFSAERVISRTTKAVGGETALRRLQNLFLRAEWSEGGANFAGVYRATRDGLMRIDVYVDGKRVFSEGIDAGGAWEQPGADQPIKDVGAAARAALTHGVEYRFNGIWFARERGNQVIPVGRETVDGIDYYVVKLAFQDGFETLFYVNPGTWLIERQRDHRAYHPSSDPKKITVENVFVEFTTACGVKIPSRQRDRDMGGNKTLSETAVVDARCNLPIEKLDIGRPG